MTKGTKAFVFVFITSVNLVSVCGKAVFEKSVQIDLTRDFGDYELTTPYEEARSVVECSAICYRIDNCRSFLMNQLTGECKAYDRDLTEDTAPGVVMNNDTFIFYKDSGIDLVAGRGDHSWQVSQIIPSEGFSYLALDGDTSPNWSSMSCMHTSDVEDPWWAVDFGSYAKVSRIEVYQRTDTCCVHLFAGISFMVGDTIAELDSYSGTMCAVYEGPASTTPFPITVYCDSVVWGRYLKVFKETSTRKNLVFCEIKVFSF